MISETRNRISNLHVTCIEEEIQLLIEGDRDYQENGGMDAREAYIKGLEFINNLKL